MSLGRCNTYTHTYTAQKATINQVTTMLATSKTVIIQVNHQYQCLAGGYDLEIGHF